jgi:uncharacterized protein with HEPN domain
MKRDRMFLKHIQEAIEKISAYTKDCGELRLADQKTRDAVILNFEVIGEAAKHLSADVRNLRPDIPWRQIGAMRDRLVHEYFNVDLELVGQVITNELPALLTAVEQALQEIEH